MSNQSGRDITRQICEVWRENDEERKMDIGEEKKRREREREQAAPTPNSRYVIKRSLSSDKVVVKSSNVSIQYLDKKKA